MKMLEGRLKGVPIFLSRLGFRSSFLYAWHNAFYFGVFGGAFLLHFAEFIFIHVWIFSNDTPVTQNKSI